MNRKKIIGIPIKNLENPMSRLSKVLTQDERIHTQKELIRNIVQIFKKCSFLKTVTILYPVFLLGTSIILFKKSFIRLISCTNFDSNPGSPFSA